MRRNVLHVYQAACNALKISRFNRFSFSFDETLLHLCVDNQAKEQ